MTEIHLVRHGQTDWNLERRIQGQTNSQLTELGQEQAHAAGQKLKDTHFDHAYSSSSVRTMDTARLILAGRDISINSEDDLREIHLGHWEGHLYEDIRKKDPVNYEFFWGDTSQFNVEGAETFHQLQARALNSFHRIIKAHRNQSILMVSHGAFIKALLSAIEGRHLKDFWQPPSMHNCCHSIIKENTDGSFDIIQYADLSEW